MTSPQPRLTRSGVAPAGRKDKSAYAGISKRPQLELIKGSKPEQRNKLSESFAAFWNWTKTKSSPMVHVIVAVVFLVACLLGSLFLRTQMVQNSFEAAQVTHNITVLNQDVEEDQARLDELEASLPQKAHDMGMQPADGSITIDLQGYKPSHPEGER
ncbi:hypothetical protein D2E26_0257 [Bifidobacterium dolichotidis]|uniref:Uncharacterized protein n=1 Tax=Bifidobacterium dolichotidis TaxID=2306976 RepID=A0A430FS42_9BIFI|nr:hypothetical protein [Bifidobacterium dolichotidis]RSX55694.1 hypothetical protein D2E26_0257 [Bifidobacterium dolichotidis]